MLLKSLKKGENTLIVLDANSLNIKQVRSLLIVGTGLMGNFMLADLALLPEPLTSLYLSARLYMQFPVCIAFIVCTFHHDYARFHQWITLTCMLVLTFINYWLIWRCWDLQQYGFPYEGTILYSLYAIFILRMQLRFAIGFVLLTLAGFAFLTLNFPIYGEKNLVTLGFVASCLIIGLMGVQQIEKAFEKLKRANTHLTSLSQIDQLTNILNRGTYESRFAEQLEFNKRNGNTMALFIIDLDHFKDYNDGYGHLKGDDIIKLQAEMLSRTFRRNTDIVARYGGEEFVVVTSNITVSQCEQFARQLIAQWDTQKLPHEKTQDQPFVTCSVGFHFEHITLNSEPKTMFKRADEALYRAKSEGRNRFASSLSLNKG